MSLDKLYLPLVEAHTEIPFIGHDPLIWDMTHSYMIYMYTHTFTYSWLYLPIIKALTEI